MARTRRARLRRPGRPPGLLTISGRHGSVRRDGRWTLPRRLALRTAWCQVMLDLTSSVRSGPELVTGLRVRSGDVELVLAPGGRGSGIGFRAFHDEVALDHAA